MAAAPDWTQLPAELLRLISERLADNPLDRIRFRSVCSTWRSSISPFIPFNFPTISAAQNAASTFSLSARSLFLIKPPPHQQTQTPWLVKIGQDSLGRNRLWHPLFRDRTFPTSSRRVLDFSTHLVSHLRNEFIVSYPPYQPNSRGKVVTTSQGSMLFKIHDSRMLAFFRGGDGDGERWRFIPDKTTHGFMKFHDACAFNGRFYTVGGYGHGRTVVTGPDAVMEELVADHRDDDDEKHCCKNKKYLVESNGELLLVVKHWRYCKYLKYVKVVDFEDYEVGMERAARIDVYRLEENERRWVKVKSLGDRVLFLGDDCTFSASASDLGVDRGNCVVFGDEAMDSRIGVLSLDEVWDDRRILRLENYPGYSRLFLWPPPDWVMLH